MPRAIKTDFDLLRQQAIKMKLAWGYDARAHGDDVWCCEASMLADFESEMRTMGSASLLFAWYDGCNNYSGDAWVLFSRGGKLFEVHGGHCSCYGLEGQWEEEEVTLQQILARHGEAEDKFREIYGLGKVVLGE